MMYCPSYSLISMIRPIQTSEKKMPLDEVLYYYYMKKKAYYICQTNNR